MYDHRNGSSQSSHSGHGYGGRGGSSYGGGHAGRDHGRSESRPKSGTAADLREHLRSIDHRGYPAYKELAGQYTFDGYTLSIDHVQGDPFASPSALSIHVPGARAAFPKEMWENYDARVALTDHLTRLFAGISDAYSHKAGGSGKSGLIRCTHPGQEILDTSACQIDPSTGKVIFRFYVGFPAAGRTVLAGELEKILFEFLPDCARRSLFYEQIDKKKVREAVELREDQTFLRREMERRGFVAFVADGSVLPRESGVSQRPMKGAVPFISPDEDAMTVELPHKGAVRGMAVRKGITLIIGGGYHGKSTLLKALERGVYDHIAGDGRELVLTDATAMKIRAEDGRYISNDDISPFIRNLPSGKDTRAFSTEDASGSTSQAAAVTEAVESGARVLLMDEDTCAANFMVRDELMRRIVSPREEPIIPYSETMRPLYEKLGISTVLVAGSSGAFFSVADTVLQMKEYLPKDVTKVVREVGPAGSEPNRTAAASENAAEASGRSGLSSESDSTSKRLTPFQWDFSVRKPKAGAAFRGRDGRVKLKSLGRDGFMVGHETVDLRAVEQIVSEGQTECLSQMLLLLSEEMDGRTSLGQLIGRLMKNIEQNGLAAAVHGRLPGNLAMPRAQELYAAADRCRSLRM